MERDMGLCRAILLEVEKLPYDSGFHDIAIEGSSPETITYHVRLLTEAGLIEAQKHSDWDGPSWKPKRLTWSGHEFLDAARSETVWNKAKETVIDSTGTLTLEALKIILPQVMRSLMPIA